jgi:hypothetical protein
MLQLHEKDVTSFYDDVQEIISQNLACNLTEQDIEKICNENEVDWKQALKRWIATAKKSEMIFVEVDLSGWHDQTQMKAIVR